MHGKELLYRWFKRQNFQVDIEYYLPEIKQRPDVFVERAGRKIAIEYQCANLAIEAAVQKNIFVLASWYTGHLDRWWKSIEKAICILDEIFLTYGFLLTILSSATSYFLLSETKSFMKCAFVTPFSTNVFFSHTIYLPTDTTTFEMLFSLVPFGKERLGEEWKKRKSYFRKMPCRFGIIIISHYYASYINLNVPQRAFLLKLVFHSLLDLLFKQTHLYGKLFSI